MKTKLITGLRTAAKALEQGTFYYEWQQNSSCNCGSLFCALTGKSAMDLENAKPASMDGKGASWTKLIGQHCPITGVPMQELFKELFGYGLTQQDMVHLENLSDPRVLARVNATKEVHIKKLAGHHRGFFGSKPIFKTEIKTVPRDLAYDHKPDVILYMRAWASLLEEEGRLDCTESLPSTNVHAAGFTMVEVLIVVAIAAILAVMIAGARHTYTKGGHLAAADQIEVSTNSTATFSKDVSAASGEPSNWGPAITINIHGPGEACSLDDIIARETNADFAAILTTVNRVHKDGHDRIMIRAMDLGTRAVLDQALQKLNRPIFGTNGEKL